MVVDIICQINIITNVGIVREERIEEIYGTNMN